MSVRTDVLLWAQRVIARKGSAPYVLLEVGETATYEQVQEAFHKIARTAHPDLHRHGLDATELELVTSAYAVVAGAYAQLRSGLVRTQRIKPLRSDDPAAPQVVQPPRATGTPPTGTTGSVPTVGAARRAPSSPPASELPKPPSSPPPLRRAPTAPPTGAPAPAGTGHPAEKMSAKALLYYRKAETCLGRGDRKGAILQLKLACAVDPTSSFLRTALADVVSEANKAQ